MGFAADGRFSDTVKFSLGSETPSLIIGIDMHFLSFAGVSKATEYGPEV
jgi:hypothetical protein